jgi:RNA recognition motif-containing protein
MEPCSNKCKGVGFVNYAEAGAALRAMQALHGTKAGERLLHVSLQTPRLRPVPLAHMGMGSS